MWCNIDYEKPKQDEHVYIWDGYEAKLMMWHDGEFIQPKHDWLVGVDGLHSYAWIANNYKLWFKIEPPTMMDEE